MRKSFIGVNSSFQAYQIVRYAMVLLSSVALARIFPDKGIPGEWEKLVFLGGALSGFWISGLYDAFIPFYKNGGENGSNWLVSKVFRISLGLGLVSGLLVAGLGRWMFPDIGVPSLILYGGILSLTGPGYLLEYSLLVRGKSRALLQIGSLFWVGYWVLLVGPLALGFSLNTSLFSLLGLGAIKVGILVKMEPGVIRFWDASSNGKALWRAFIPLALVGFVSGSATYMDRFLVGTLHPGNNDSFVFYSYGARELPITLLLATSLSLLHAGELAEAIRKGRERTALDGLRKGANRLIFVLFPLTFLLMLVSKPLFSSVFGQNYQAASGIFDVYLLLIIPRLTFPQAVVRARLANQVLLFSASLELVANLCFSAIFMQFWGLEGIALGTVVAFSLEKAILSTYCYVRWKTPFHLHTPFLPWAFGSLLVLGLYLAKLLHLLPDLY